MLKKSAGAGKVKVQAKAKVEARMKERQIFAQP
jgi:hypothetical protein